MKQENLLPSIRVADTEPFIPAVRSWNRVGLREIVQKLVNLLSGDRQPQVYHRRDRQGHSYLEVYDPTSRKTHTFNTAYEARVWLERRYYS